MSDDGFDDPFGNQGGDDAGDETGTDSAAEDASRDVDTEGPLEDLRREIESRTEAEASTQSPGDLFTREPVETVDTDAVWDDLLAHDDGPVEREAAGDEEHVVSKRLCHRCRYFGDPPDLHCTHDGTTIEAVVDMDHYRVSSCPMVDTADDAGPAP